MRPALLLRLLLWGPLLWGRLRPERGLQSVRVPRYSIYWNSSNPSFLHDDYAVQVSINDYLEIYCPHYEQPVPAGQAETFSLRMVDTEGYRGCYETPGAFKLWECNRPHAPFGPIRFFEKIRRFTPFVLGFEYQPGETYYIISVPTPESAGRCLRLRVAVCCKATTTKPVTEVPKSQPRGRGGSEDTESPGHSTALATLRPHGPCLSLALIPLPLLWL